MKLKRLRIENFKRFRAPLEINGFTDGLNLFTAPNESGKSTVAEAIPCAFFERHRSSSVEYFRPWGESSSTPTVELDCWPSMMCKPHLGMLKMCASHFTLGRF